MLISGRARERESVLEVAPGNKAKSKMPVVTRVGDVEQGLGPPHTHVVWDGNDEQSVVSMSNYVAGILLFLFLAGLLPLSLLVLASVLLVCLATCIRAYVIHQFEQSINTGQGMSTLAEAFQAVSGTQPLLLQGGQQINLQNLRLTLIQRDFGSADYESLLALDSSSPLEPGQCVSDNLLKSLPTFRHCRCPVGKEGEEHICSVCLEPLAEGHMVTQLPCSHLFHGDCIQPWLRQQGKAATCPLCKSRPFAQK